MEYRRYAIYYAPPAGSALAAFGAAWLGWDAEAQGEVARPTVAGLDTPVEALTANPRRYGFHGTLKPPFRLAEGCSVVDLEAAVAAFAATWRPFDAPPLRVATDHGFLSLRLSAYCPEMAALADGVVEQLDRFRAPPAEAELARRRQSGLTPRQDANLQRWGYPYVFEDFHFHLTLSNHLGETRAAQLADLLADRLAPLCRDPMLVREVALFGDPGDGPFHLLHRYALSG
ncbi:MAG: DUF1045 domain-containing protein [Pseudomonadota bacterium]